MIPPKLKSGDELRVIAPARSLAMIPADQRSLSLKRLEDLGLKVSLVVTSKSAMTLSHPLLSLVCWISTTRSLIRCKSHSVRYRRIQFQSTSAIHQL